MFEDQVSIGFLTSLVIHEYVYFIEINLRITIILTLKSMEVNGDR